MDGNTIRCTDSIAIIQAVPDTGYHFVVWNNSRVSNPDTLYLTQDTTFTAYFEKNSYAMQALTANDTMGGAAVNDTLPLYLDTVLFTATANYGYHFTQWQDGNVENPRALTVTCDSSLTAHFARNSYHVALAVDTAIHGTTSGEGNYLYLETPTLTATANYGYHFTQWQDGNTDNPRTITLICDTTFTAYFEKNSYVMQALTANDTMGGAAVNDTLPLYLDMVLFTATAHYGYHFTQWQDGNTENPRTLTVIQDSTLTAHFARNSYHVTLAVDTAIHGTTSGEGNYLYLETPQLTATANYGYHFTQWQDGNTDNPRTITITCDTAFTAYFEKNLYHIAVAVNDSTLGYATGGGTVFYLDSMQVQAVCTAEHYHFVQWSDGITEANRTLTVERDSLLVAIFAIDTHVVTIASNNVNYGQVQGPTAAAYGTDITLTATAEEGYHFGRWSNGTTENPYTLTIHGDTSLTALFTDDLYPELCMVIVHGGRNQLTWSAIEEPCSAYRLYREGSTAGVYELMAEVPADSATLYVDSTSRPMTRSYRYRISGVDPYGLEGAQSEEHKTMHLTISQGVGNRWNLVWTEYEGADYTTYIIYRGTSMEDLQQIDEMPSGGNTTYTDEEAPEGEVYYQVGVVMSTTCGQEIPSKTTAISRSNIATNGQVGIGRAVADDVHVYAQRGRIVVTGIGGRGVKLFDVNDRQLQATYDGADTQYFPVPASGAYFVKVGSLPVHKVVVVK